MTDVPPQRGTDALVPRDELWTMLCAAQTALDPVPDAVLAGARGAFAWRTIDAELAELVEDSALDALAGVRGTGPRLLTFEAGSATVVVQVTDEGRSHRLLGQLVQPQPADIEVRHATGTVTVRADDLGRFAVDTVPSGPVRLACRFAGSPAQTVITSVVTL